MRLPARLAVACIAVAACVRAPAAVSPAAPASPAPARAAHDALRQEAAAAAPAVPGPSPPRVPVDVEQLLAQMTLEQKVGQLMMVGFGGQEVDPGIEALVRGRRVGGVCMFKRNIAGAEQVARLNDQVRALLADEVPPFIAVDQEGGNVVRVDDRNLVLPGNMALAATRDATLAYEAGLAQGEDLRRLGFNMNLAPVLDVNTNPRNPVIGVRSFGDNVDLVAELGAQFVRGQQDARIVTVAKHFPGHGSVDSDSHRALPVVYESEAELKRQLKPFEVAMAVGLDGMMTAHVATPTLSGDDTPATLSERVLSDLLRRRMGFTGLVLTDELEMEAIVERYGVGRAAVLAVNAGADMVLVPWRVERKTEVWQALLEASRSGALPQARLDASVRRILALKVKRGLFEPLPPREERLRSLGEKRALADRIAREAVTLLRAEPGAFPVEARRKVLVVTAEAALSEAVARRAPATTAMVVPAFPLETSVHALKVQARKLADQAEVVVLGAVNGKQLELLPALAVSGKPVVVVVMGAPYLAVQAAQAKAVLSVYSYRESAAEAAAAALFGEAGTPGRLPVALPRMPFGFGLDPVGGTLARSKAEPHAAPAGAP